MENANVPSDYGDEVRTRAIRRAKLTLVPFAGLMYFFNGMDRVNISFATLRMNESFPVSVLDFANLISVFFISYLIFQIPSNMIMEKIGAKRWIGTIVAGWGVATTAMFFVTNVTEVIWCRLLLGVFEAGFFPGMIFYFALWFPKRELADVTAWFFFATAGSAVVGGPFAGWVVGHFDVFGYAGWRWLFILEGAPTVLCGIGALFLLYDSPKDAPWLKPDERAWLINQLAKEQAESTVVKRAGLLQALSSPVLWLLAMIYMCFQAAAQTAQLWFPGVLKGLNFGLTDTEVGFIMALPFLGAMICLTVWGRHSDRTGERKWHTVAAMVLAAVSLLAFLILPALWMKIVTVTLYGVGTYCCYGTYWAIPAIMISPAALAVSVAFINSCSSLGGFLGAKILGYVQVSFGMPGLFVTMTLMMLVAILLLAVMRVPREHRA